MRTKNRLLGVRISEDCNKAYRKILKENKLYILCSDYEESDSVYTLKHKESQHSEIADSLYDIQRGNGDPISVNISAVVGPNGCGKSTFVELIIRLLNNFMWACGFSSINPSIQRVVDLSGFLYYEQDGHVYVIEQSINMVVSLFKDGKKILELPNTLSEEDKLYYFKEFADDFFYSIVVNYSLYAYNSNNLIKESEIPTGAWIEGLFQHDGSYQTPVSIIPKRQKGIIDVNEESFLAQQRLMMLYSMADDESSRIIDEGIVAKGFAFGVERSSRFIEDGIEQYFSKTRLKLRRWDSLESIIGSSVFIESFSRFLHSFYVDYHNNTLLWGIVSSASAQNGQSSGDLCEVFISISKSISPRLIQKQIPEYEEVAALFTNGALKSMNLAQLFRVFLYEYVWSHLTSRFHTNDTIEMAIGNSDDPQYAAMLYSVHKIISILDSDYSYLQKGSISSFDFNLLLNPVMEYFDSLPIVAEIEIIMKQSDYSTLELRQTFHYLSNINRIEYFGAEPKSGDIYGFDRYVSFDVLKSMLDGSAYDMNGYKQIECLPPPIFVGDIVVSKDNDKFCMSALSSGIVQRLRSVSSILYDLRNMDEELNKESITNIDYIHFSHISIILEEVELYFHPEYQKSFIKYLLEQIGLLKLKNIKSLDFLFVTHSPFILSDVLRNNILCIQDGEMRTNVISHTFGANVHDILSESFFLHNGSIGDYAQRHIKSIVDSLKDIDDGCEVESNRDYLFEKIMLIDEPIARSLLLDSLKHKCELSVSQKIKLLEKQIEDLKQR